jgi:hypothetical protein
MMKGSSVVKDDRARPVVRRPRKGDKPPIPANLKVEAEKAKERHRKRHLSPGIAVEVEKVSRDGYRLASPHADQGAWIAMLCDALGTRSESTARVFAYQLTKLCSQRWHPSDDEEQGGEWCPDQDELNLILNFVAGTKPRNEMEAALAAQMCAIHMLSMKTAAAAMEGWSVMDPRMAAITGKLARTFVMQTDAMAKLKGKKTTRQKITVRYERHEHTYSHVRFEGGPHDFGGRGHEPCGDGNGGNNRAAPVIEHEGRPALPGPDAPGNVVPMPRKQGKEAMPKARRG